MNSKKQVMIEIAAVFQNSFGSVFESADERIGGLKKRLKELDAAAGSVSSMRTLQSETEALKQKIEDAEKTLPGLRDAHLAASKAQELQKLKTVELSEEVKKHRAIVGDAKAKESELKDEVNRLTAAKKEQKNALKEAKKEVKNLSEAFEQTKKTYWDHAAATKDLTIQSKLSAEQMAVEKAKSQALKEEMDLRLRAYLAAKERLPSLTGEVKKLSIAIDAQKNILAAEQPILKSHQANLSSAKATLSSHTMTVKAENKVLAEGKVGLDHLKMALDTTETELKENRAAFDSNTASIHKYSEALKETGHDAKHLAELQAEVGRETAKTQKTHDLANRRKKVSDRGRELRTDIVGSAFELTGMALTLGTPIKIAAQFDHAMAKVGAQTMATTEELKVLTKQARLLGDTTVFSSSEAAAAESYLATAGFGVQDIVDSLAGVLDLAAAGEVGLGESAEMASNMLAGFKLDATDMNRVANVMTATFIATNTDLTGLAETMKYVAPIASALGASIEEVSAASGLLGNVGLQGSMAGTALRSMYQRLASPPAAGREALRLLNVELKDANKNLLPMPQILEQLDKNLRGKGSAERAKFIKDIFGEEAAAGATELLGQAGSGSLRFEIKKLEMAPAFRASIKYLQDNLTNEDFKGLENRFGIAFKDGVSKSNLSEISKAFTGLKGSDFEKRFSEIFKFSPKIDKMELDLDTKAAQQKLKDLKISRRGGDKKEKSYDQMTKEIEQAVSTLPEPQRLEAISILFSRSKNEMHGLMLEAAQGQDKFKILTDALEKTNSAQEISEKLNKTAVGEWKNLQSSVEAVAISVGVVFLPKLSEMMRSLSDTTLKVSSLATEHNTVVEVIGTFGAVLAASKAAMISYKVVLWTLNSVLEIVTIAQTALNFVMQINPVVAAISLMLAFITALWAAVLNWDKVLVFLEKAKNWILDFWDNIGPIMKSIGEFLAFGETRDLNLKVTEKLQIQDGEGPYLSRIPKIPERLPVDGGSKNQNVNVEQKFDITVQGGDRTPEDLAEKIKDRMKINFKPSNFSYSDSLGF